MNRPTTEYEDYISQIEMLQDTGINPTYQEDVLRLCPTSGTSGKNKLIPYTKSLKIAFQRGVYPWIFFLYVRFPKLFFLRQYWSVTPVIKNDYSPAESRIKVGFEDDEEYIGSIQRMITKVIWVDTSRISQESGDVDTFLSILAKKLSNEKELGLVSVWSPSLLSLLIRNHGAVLPKKLVLSSWAHGYSEKESHGIARNIEAELQPKGLLSTEACVTIPIGTQTFLLAYGSHYLEFRDIDSCVLLTADSLIINHEYEVIVTTQSGFLRYATGDILKVTKFFFGRPSCVFIGRLGVVDLFGEKLSELTIEKEIGGLLAESEIRDIFWFLAPTENDDLSVAYTLFIATEEVDLSSLSERIDECLRKSYHYEYCRSLGQLVATAVFIIKDPSPETLFIEASAQGSNARIGDIKMKRLSKKMDWHRVFSGYFLKTR